MYGLHHILRRLLCGLVFLFSVGSLSAQSGTLATQGVTVNYGYVDGVLSWEVPSVTVGSGLHVVLEVGADRVGNWPNMTTVSGSGSMSFSGERIVFLGVYMSYDPWTLLGSQQVTLGGLASQNISVSRAPGQDGPMASVPERWTVAGVAIGRQLYLDSANGCSVSINQSTRELTVLPEEGAYSFSVYAEGGGGYAQSNTATGSGNAEAFLYTFCFDISAAWAEIVATTPPGYAKELPWLIKQGEEILASGIYGMGQLGGLEVCATSDSKDPAAELYYGTRYRFDPESGYWVRLEEGEMDWYKVDTAEASSSPTQSLSNAATPRPAGSAGGSVGQNSTAWNTVTSGNRDDLLTKGVFAEGASKIEDGIRSQAAAIAQAGVALESAAGAVTSAASEISGAADALADAAEGLAGSIGDLGDDVGRAADAAESIDGKMVDPADAQAEAEQAMEDAAAASLAAQDEARNLLPSMPPPMPLTRGEISKPDFTIQFPVAFGGVIIDLDPFREDRLGPLIRWFREAMAWLALVLWGYWVSGEVKEWIRGFSTLRQAGGNAVVGGTGAQATALLNAGIITVAFAVFVAALLGYLTGDLSIAAVFSAVTSGSSVVGGLATAVPGALWMLEEVFPVAMLVNILLLRVTWRFWGAQVFGVAAAVVRFAIG